MLNFQRLAIEHFVKEVKTTYSETYGSIEPQFGNIIAWSGRLVLENIANSDALYHNVSHTVMVTLAGQAILEGKQLREGGVTPTDWLHTMIAFLCHDIGYVRGVCRNDHGNRFATGIGEERVEIPSGSTDVVLTPYHVDRSKLFVRERFGGKLLEGLNEVIDAEVIASYIEMTRFPVPDDERYRDTKGYGGIVRAADFIGQLGDPDYLRKTPALFYEFEELGDNEKLGYQRPGDLRDNYARFYWNVVSPLIQDALRYLRITQVGKEWINSLYSHVFTAEHDRTSQEEIV
ncbi:MAG: hypothetical protein QG552_2452 [Thermodesulfobacteriota bacterium]|nr:hypothetical protein [Thermodesulfobacteriota bacterium]